MSNDLGLIPVLSSKEDDKLSGQSLTAICQILTVLCPESDCLTESNCLVRAESDCLVCQLTVL